MGEVKPIPVNSQGNGEEAIRSVETLERGNTDPSETHQSVHVGPDLLRQVIDSLPLAVAVVDRSGDVVLANPASTRLWGRVIQSGEERYEKSTGFWHDSGKRVAPDEWPSIRALDLGETSLGNVIDI